MYDTKLTIIELEFSNQDTIFWTGGDASGRIVYLMPLPKMPSEFIAFGVVPQTETLVFVAQGRVREDLGAFIERMRKDDVKVELYARAPLPGSVLNAYIKDGGFEGQIVDPPPPDDSKPILGGTQKAGLTATTKTSTQEKASAGKGKSKDQPLS